MGEYFIGRTEYGVPVLAPGLAIVDTLKFLQTMPHTYHHGSVSTLKSLDVLGGGIDALINYTLDNLEESIQKDTILLVCLRGIYLKAEKKHRRRMKKWKNYKF